MKEERRKRAGHEVIWLGSADRIGMADRISRFLRSASGMLGGQEAKGSRRIVQGKRKTEKPEHKEAEADQSVSGLSARLRFQLRIGRLRTEPI